jgi:hypothetical protein
MKRGKNSLFRKNNGQVWIETVIYTLIGLLMIGLVLSYAKPAIEEAQDNAILKQSTQMLEKIDSQILTIGPPGSQKEMSVLINKGELKIDGTEGNEKIVFQMDSKYYFSEENKNVSIGRINSSTQIINDINLVTLTLEYGTNYNITIDGIDKIKTLSKSPNPYKIFIVNNGRYPPTTGKVQIDISVD